MNPFTSSEQPSPESQRAAQSEDSIDVSSDILMQPLPPNYAEPADQSGGGGGLELQAATSNVREFGRAEDAGLETMEQENRASLVSNASVRLSPAAMSNSLSRSAPDAGRERYATTNWQTTSYEESSDGNFLVERSRSNLASSMVLPTNSNMSASNQESLDFNDCAQCHGHSADTINRPCGHSLLCMACALGFRDEDGQQQCNLCQQPSTLEIILSKEHDLTCVVCDEAWNPSFMFVPGACSHALCIGCTTQVARDAHGDRNRVTAEGVQCGFSNCSASFSLEMLRVILSVGNCVLPDTRAQHGDPPLLIQALTEDELAMLERYVNEEAVPSSHRAWCPNADCGKFLNLPRTSVPVMAKCTWCGASLCSKCLFAWEEHERNGRAWPSCLAAARSRRRSKAKDSRNCGEKASLAFIKATSKSCPTCAYAISHFHGHSCHHISPDTDGCPSCHTHFCYACLATGTENQNARGSRQSCACPERYWSAFCSSTDVIDNLEAQPYPHDRRCGCPICPYCRPSNPCEQCPGSCPVCTGVVDPGPTELPEKPPVVVTFACLPQVVSQVTFYGDHGPTGLVFGSNGYVVTGVSDDAGADNEMLIDDLVVELNGQTLKPSCFEGNLADHLTNLARPFTLSFTRDNFALCSECDRSSRLTAPAGAAPGDPAWIYWSGLRPQPDDLVTGEVVDLTGQPYEAASSSEDMFQGQEEEGGNDDERWLKIHVPEYTLGYRRCYVPLTDISGVPILEPFEAPFQAGDPIRVPLIPEAEARRLTEEYHGLCTWKFGMVACLGQVGIAMRMSWDPDLAEEGCLVRFAGSTNWHLDDKLVVRVKPDSPTGRTQLVPRPPPASLPRSLLIGPLRPFESHRTAGLPNPPIMVGEAIRIRAVSFGDVLSEQNRYCDDESQYFSGEKEALLGRTGTCDGITDDGRILCMEFSWSPWLVERAGAFVNDEGACLHFGSGVDGRVYCGRHLGRFSVPGSRDGRCGPHGGPQCESCRRWTKGTNEHAVRLGHRDGQWRMGHHSGQISCSRREAPDGDLCRHMPAKVPFPHWSCCGVSHENSRCLRGEVHPWHTAHPLLSFTLFDLTFDVQDFCRMGLHLRNLHSSLGGGLVVKSVHATISHLFSVGDEVVGLNGTRFPTVLYDTFIRGQFHHLNRLPEITLTMLRRETGLSTIVFSPPPASSTERSGNYLESKEISMEQSSVSNAHRTTLDSSNDQAWSAGFASVTNTSQHQCIVPESIRNGVYGGDYMSSRSGWECSGCASPGGCVGPRKKCNGVWSVWYSCTAGCDFKLCQECYALGYAAPPPFKVGDTVMVKQSVTEKVAEDSLTALGQTLSANARVLLGFCPGEIDGCASPVTSPLRIFGVDHGTVIVNGVRLSTELVDRCQVSMMPPEAPENKGAEAPTTPMLRHPWHAHPLTYREDPLESFAAACRDNAVHTYLVIDEDYEVTGDACDAIAENFNEVDVLNDPHFFHGRRQLQNGDTASLIDSLSSGDCAIRLHRNHHIAIVRSFGIAIDESCLEENEKYEVSVPEAYSLNCTVKKAPRIGVGPTSTCGSLCVDSPWHDKKEDNLLASNEGDSGDLILSVNGVRKHWTQESYQNSVLFLESCKMAYTITFARARATHKDRLWTCAGHWQPGGCRSGTVCSDKFAFTCLECLPLHSRPFRDVSQPKGFNLCAACFHLGQLASNDLKIGTMVQVHPSLSSSDIKDIQESSGVPMLSDDMCPEVFPGVVGALEAVNPETGMLKITGIDAYLHPTLAAAAPFQAGDEVRLRLTTGSEDKETLVVARVQNWGVTAVSPGSSTVQYSGSLRNLEKVWRVHSWHENHLRGGIAPDTQVACSSLTGQAAVHNGAEGQVKSVVNARGRQRVQLQNNCEKYFLPENLVPLDNLFEEPFHRLKQVYRLDKWYCHGRNYAGGCRGPHGGSARGGPIGQPRFQCLDQGCDFSLCKDCYELKLPPKPFQVGDAVRITPYSIEDAAAQSKGHGGWQRGSMSKLLGSSGFVQEVMEAEWWQPRLVRVLGKLWNPAMIEHLPAGEIPADREASEEVTDSTGWNLLNVHTDVSKINASTMEEAMAELELKASPSIRDYLSGAFSDLVLNKFYEQDCWGTGRLSVKECAWVIINDIVSGAANHCHEDQRPRCLASHIIPGPLDHGDEYEYNFYDDEDSDNDETRRICDGPCSGVKSHGISMYRCRLCKYSMCYSCYDDERHRIRVRTRPQITVKECTHYCDLFAEAPNNGVTMNEFASVARYAILVAHNSTESTIYQIGDVVRVKTMADLEARALQGQLDWVDNHKWLQGHRIAVIDTTSRGNLDLVRANGLDWCPDMLEHCVGEDAIEGRGLEVGDEVVLSPAARFFPQEIFDGCLDFGRVGIVVDITEDWPPLKVEYGDQFGFYHEPMLIRAPLLYDRGREWPQLAADDACLTPEGSYCKVLSLGDSEWELHIQELYPESRNIRVVRQELLQRLPRVGEIARVRSLPLADVQWLMIRHGGVSYGMSLLLGCVGVVEGTFVMGGSTFVRMLGHAWSPQMLEPATPREVATGLARPTMALHTHGSTAYLKVEDNVRIKPVSVVDARKLQRDHGGWNNRMASLIGTIGSVTKVWPNRTDSSGSTWMAAVEGLCWNPALLERMNKQGDFVSVLPANTSPIDGFLNAWDFAEDGLDSGDAEISESAKTTIEFTFEAKTPLGLRVRKIDGGVAGGNLVVSSVLVGGLAAAQQVRVGDWIATLNGKPVDATTSAACFVDHVRAANRPFSIGMLRLHRLEDSARIFSVRKEANLSYMAAGLPELLCFFVNASGLQIANAEHRVLRSFGFADIHEWYGAASDFSIQFLDANAANKQELVVSTEEAADLSEVLFQFKHASLGLPSGAVDATDFSIGEAVWYDSVTQWFSATVVAVSKGSLTLQSSMNDATYPLRDVDPSWLARDWLHRPYNCPCRRGLCVFITQSHGHFCLICEVQLLAGTKMHGCRICDFDVCKSCLKAPPRPSGEFLDGNDGKVFVALDLPGTLRVSDLRSHLEISSETLPCRSIGAEVHVAGVQRNSNNTSRSCLVVMKSSGPIYAAGLRVGDEFVFFNGFHCRSRPLAEMLAMIVSACRFDQPCKLTVSRPDPSIAQYTDRFFDLLVRMFHRDIPVVVRLLCMCSNNSLSDFLDSNQFYQSAKAYFKDLELHHGESTLNVSEVYRTFEESCKILARGFEVSSFCCQQVCNFYAFSKETLVFEKFFGLLTCCLLVSDAVKNPRVFEAIPHAERAIYVINNGLCTRRASRNIVAIPRLSGQVSRSIQLIVASPVFQNHWREKFLALTLDDDGNMVDALELRQLLAQLIQVKPWVLREEHCESFLNILLKDGKLSAELYEQAFRAAFLVQNAPKHFCFQDV